MFQRSFWENNKKFSIFYYLKNYNCDFFFEKKKAGCVVDFIDVFFTAVHALKLPAIEFIIKFIFFIVLYFASFIYLTIYATVLFIKFLLLIYEFAVYIYVEKNNPKFIFIKPKKILFNITERSIWRIAIRHIDNITSRVICTSLFLLVKGKKKEFLKKLNLALLHASMCKFFGKPVWVIENIQKANEHFYSFFFYNSIWNEKLISIYYKIIIREITLYINNYSIQALIHYNYLPKFIIYGRLVHQKIGAFLNRHHNHIINTQAIISNNKNINHQAFTITPEDKYCVIFTLTSHSTYTEKISFELNQENNFLKNEKEVRLTAFSIGKKISGNQQYAAVTVQHYPLLKHKFSLLSNVLKNNLYSFKNGFLDIEELTSFIIKTELVGLLSTSTELIVKDLVGGKAVLIKNEKPVSIMQHLHKLGFELTTGGGGYTFVDTAQAQNEFRETLISLNNEELSRFFFDTSPNTFKSLKENLTILLNENKTLTFL